MYFGWHIAAILENLYSGETNETKETRSPASDDGKPVAVLTWQAISGAERTSGRDVDRVGNLATPGLAWSTDRAGCQPKRRSELPRQGGGQAIGVSVLAPIH